MEICHVNISYWRLNAIPYISVVEMSEEELMLFIPKLTRLDIIEWLSWNDPNGIYSDKSSLNEFGTVMSLEEGVEIFLRQAEENRVVKRLRIV
ncbi:hypothetical protein D0C36_19435 [Mucilaginibacter conchicola]|uniref:Uncharacterized protein n=1 Tax=Mucilaginibacter conchicola TaxID=2303333 RepID=A0A372NQA0_9SPHI|nr:hypothetical protein [Mucilaginibacter conchicola]RFZ91116.1 hypothetical protein D0C36_19435 [Mucilaginibacter conchicola]